MIGSWLELTQESPLVQQILARQQPVSILMIRDGSELGEGEELTTRIGRRDPFIPCTTAAIERFLRALGASCTRL